MKKEQGNFASLTTEQIMKLKEFEQTFNSMEGSHIFLLAYAE